MDTSFFKALLCAARNTSPNKVTLCQNLKIQPTLWSRSSQWITRKRRQTNRR